METRTASTIWRILNSPSHMHAVRLDPRARMARLKYHWVGLLGCISWLTPAYDIIVSFPRFHCIMCINGTFIAIIIDIYFQLETNMLLTASH